MIDKFRLRIILLILIVILLIVGCSLTKEYDLVAENPCENSVDEFDCLVMWGIEESNPHYCQFLSEEKDMCYQILALRVSDLNICEEIINLDETQMCKIVIAVDREDIDLCKNFAYEDNEDNWNAGKITKIMCEIYIKKIVEGEEEHFFAANLIRDCQELVKMEDDIEKQKYMLDDCHFSNALATNNLTLCDSIDSVQRYFCQARVLARNE